MSYSTGSKGLVLKETVVSKRERLWCSLCFFLSLLSEKLDLCKAGSEMSKSLFFFKSALGTLDCRTEEKHVEMGRGASQAAVLPGWNTCRSSKDKITLQGCPHLQQEGWAFISPGQYFMRCSPSRKDVWLWANLFSATEKPLKVADSWGPAALSASCGLSPSFLNEDLGPYRSSHPTAWRVPVEKFIFKFPKF